MRKFLKVLNPFIWLINFFNYMAHSQHEAEVNRRRCECKRKYTPYDFSKDIKYF